MWTETQRENKQELAELLAESVASRLKEVIAEKEKAVLVVSGGSTPQPFFQALSEQQLDWAKVSITLADERWLDVEDVRSNEKLVRENLLQNEARLAYFLGLKNSADSPAEGIMDCETNLRTQNMEPDVVILGMGDDGHTASWFPGSQQLAALTDIENSAWCFPVEDEFLAEPRMSLSWRLMSKAKKIYLHFTGEDKRPVFERAQQSRSDALPVSLILHQSHVPVSIFYSL